MKNINKLLAILLLAIFAISCTNEEDYQGNNVIMKIMLLIIKILNLIMNIQMNIFIKESMNTSKIIFLKMT